MENQVPKELGHAPNVYKLFVDDPFFECVQEINDLVARPAYELFEFNGRAHGSDREHWLHAESEILHPMPVEITETEAEISVRAEVPGFGAKHLEIGVTPHRLFILGGRQGVLERSEGKIVRSGHSRNLVLATLELSTKIDPDTVRATKRVNANTLELDMTIDDPGAYTKPFHLHRNFARSKAPFQQEQVCSTR